MPSHLEKHQKGQGSPRGTLAPRAEASKTPSPSGPCVSPTWSLPEGLGWGRGGVPHGRCPGQGPDSASPPRGDSWGQGQGRAGLAEGGTEVLGPVPTESYQASRGRPCFPGFADDAGSCLWYMKCALPSCQGSYSISGAPPFLRNRGSQGVCNGAPWCPAHSWSSQHHRLPHWTPGADTPSTCPQKPPVHILVSHEVKGHLPFPI